jgi:hypothetical protein
MSIDQLNLTGFRYSGFLATFIVPRYFFPWIRLWEWWRAIQFTRVPQSSDIRKACPQEKNEIANNYRENTGGNGDPYDSNG